MRKMINLLHSPGDTVYVDTGRRVETDPKRPQIRRYPAQCTVLEAHVIFNAKGKHIEYLLKETKHSECPDRILHIQERDIRTTPEKNFK